MRKYLLRSVSGDSLKVFAQTIQGKKAVDVLAGLCLGILADGEINSREATFLEEWINKHRAFLPGFVFLKLSPKLKLIRSEEQVTPQLLQDLTVALGALVGLDDGVSVASGFKIEHAEGRPSRLIFDDLRYPISLHKKEVVITGDFENCSRVEIIEKLNELGAIPLEVLPTTRTEYIIVGGKGSKAWSSRNYGRKIERALEIKDKGYDLMIISENTFVEFYMNTPFSVLNETVVGCAQADMPLAAKTFVITGTLSMDRDAMKQWIEARGGKVSGSVSAKTHYLVAGEGGGTKRDKAESLGVAILDEAGLRALAGEG